MTGTAQTTVRNLTPLNVKALDALGCCAELGATYAVFNGDPCTASDLIVSALRSGRGEHKRSVAAVVRKLNTPDSPHVAVNIEAAMATEAAEDDAVVDAAEAAVAVDQDDEPTAEEVLGECVVDEPGADLPEATDAAADVVAGQVVKAAATFDGVARNATRSLVLVVDADALTVWFPQHGDLTSDAVQTVAADSVGRVWAADEVSKSWARRAANLARKEGDGGHADALAGVYARGGVAAE